MGILKYAPTGGARSRQKAKVFRAVFDNPGLTSRELAEKTGIPNEVLHKRLPDLRDEGLLKNGVERKCGVSGRLAVTWEMK
jgi:predicted HTH transcriptional regulator